MEYEKNRVLRSQKLTDKSYSTIYHIFIIIYGYVVLSQTEYMPKMLGGSGSNSFDMMYSEFPCIRTGGYEKDLRMYYLVTLGYRLYKTYLLLYQFCMNQHRSDFIEMFLHHSMTLVLYSFSYMMGWFKIGSVIMFLHDLVEPPLGLCVIVAEIHCHVAVISFTGVVIWTDWLYTRLIVFPQVIYFGIYTFIPVKMFPNWNDESHLDHKKWGS